MEVTTETRLSDTTATLVKSDEHGSESEPVTVPTAETSDGLLSSDLTPGPTLTEAASPARPPQSDSSSSQTHVTACQADTPETGTTSH